MMRWKSRPMSHYLAHPRDDTTLRALLTRAMHQGLTTAEAACLFRVSPSTIWRWCLDCRITPNAQARWRRRFARTYGQGALAQFQQLLASGRSLADIARTFGFSREYARQVRAHLRTGRLAVRAGATSIG